MTERKWNLELCINLNCNHIKRRGMHESTRKQRQLYKEEDEEPPWERKLKRGSFTALYWTVSLTFSPGYAQSSLTSCCLPVDTPRLQTQNNKIQMKASLAQDYNSAVPCLNPAWTLGLCVILEILWVLLLSISLWLLHLLFFLLFFLLSFFIIWLLTTHKC